MKHKPHVFLDLDGVMVDFVGGVAELFDTEMSVLERRWAAQNPRNYDVLSVLGVSLAEFWEKIDEQGEDFWANLKPYPWAEDIYKECFKIGPTVVLTSSSRHPSSLSGKMHWMKKFFGHDFRNYLVGPRKEACAGPMAILLDDAIKNVNAFTRAGGHAVLFPRPWNCANEDTYNDPRSFVQEQFEEILGKLDH